MRILEIEEVRRIQPVIDAAVEQARLSPCSKSKRGAVVFKDEKILGQDNNHPILPHTCIPDKCMKYCAFYANHAERGACQDAIFRGNNVDGASILHMKIKDGEITPVKKAECFDCSSYLMRLRESGVYVAELILMHRENNQVIYKGHTIDEFFENSRSVLHL